MNYKGGYALISMDGIVLTNDKSVILSKQKLKEFTDALKSKKRVVLTDLVDEDGNIYNACEWVLMYDGDIYLTNESSTYKMYIEILSRELTIEDSDIININGKIANLEQTKMNVLNGAEPGNIVSGNAWVVNKLVITDENGLTLTESQETNLFKQVQEILKKRYVKYADGGLYLFLTRYVNDENNIDMYFGSAYGDYYILHVQYTKATKLYTCEEHAI